MAPSTMPTAPVSGTSATDLPTTAAGRAALRDRVLIEAVQRAIQRAPQAYSSISCVQGKHAPAGCRSDGTGCLCTCHDPEEQS